MKRIGYLFEKFATYDNLDKAESKARKDKGGREEVKEFLKNREKNLRRLEDDLKNGRWHTSKRRWKKIHDPKERIIGVLPYYPDLIVQYALLNILEPIFTKMVIKDSYSCIKGRGILPCKKRVAKFLWKHREETKYAMQIDISKFYDHIVHDILKGMLRHKIKDERFLAFVFDIIDSSEGLVRRDHIASWLSNIYLNGIDHKVKEIKRIRYYVRYADDIVAFAATKKRTSRSSRLSGYRIQSHRVANKTQCENLPDRQTDTRLHRICPSSRLQPCTKKNQEKSLEKSKQHHRTRIIL